MGKKPQWRGAHKGTLLSEPLFPLAYELLKTYLLFDWLRRNLVCFNIFMFLYLENKIRRELGRLFSCY